MCQRRRRNLPAYGDLMGRHRIWHHNRPGDIAPVASVGEIARLACEPFPATLLAERGIFVAWGAAVPQQWQLAKQQWLQQARQGPDVISYPTVLVARG